MVISVGTGPSMRARKVSPDSLLSSGSGPRFFFFFFLPPIFLPAPQSRFKASSHILTFYAFFPLFFAPNPTVSGSGSGWRGCRAEVSFFLFFSFSPVHFDTAYIPQLPFNSSP